MHLKSRVVGAQPTAPESSESQCGDPAAASGPPPPRVSRRYLISVLICPGGIPAGSQEPTSPGGQGGALTRAPPSCCRGQASWGWGWGWGSLRGAAGLWPLPSTLCIHFRGQGPSRHFPEPLPCQDRHRPANANHVDLKAGGLCLGGRGCSSWGALGRSMKPRVTADT